MHLNMMNYFQLVNCPLHHSPLEYKRRTADNKKSKLNNVQNSSFLKKSIKFIRKYKIIWYNLAQKIYFLHKNNTFLMFSE